MAISQLREKDSRQMAVGRKCGTADYRTRKKEKMPRVLREPQDPEGNRGAKTQRTPSKYKFETRNPKFETISNNRNSKQKHQRVCLKGLEFLSLREMPERLLNVLNINNLRVWYCLGFRASDLGFSLWGRLGLPARRAYSPEGAKILESDH